MGLKEHLKRLEMRAVQRAEHELCPHEGPIIHWPDGTIENNTAHICSKPRLVIRLDYSDGTSQRQQQAALARFDELRQRYSDVPAGIIAEKIAQAYQATPETRARLQQRTG